MKTALKALGLTKIVDGHALVSDLSLEVSEGEAVGIAGTPHSVGTLLGLLATAIRPSAGSLEVGGIETSRHLQTARRRIAYFPGSAFDRIPLRVDEWLWWVVRSRSGDSAGVIAHRVREAISSAALASDRGVDALSPVERAALAAAATLCLPGDVILIGNLAWSQERDSRRGAALLHALRERGTTLVMPVGPDHLKGDPSFDRVLAMEAGRLVAASGKHEPDLRT